MQGFIKFYRSYLENPIITKDAEHLAVWTYILCSACFEKAEALFGGKITLMPGQALIKCKDIEEELKIERHKLWRILKLFKSEQLIEQQTNNHKTLITLLIPSDCQGKNEQPSEHQVSNKRATEQEGENEKEKRSKREKAKEGEEFKNTRMQEVCLCPKSDFARFGDPEKTPKDNPPKLASHASGSPEKNTPKLTLQAESRNTHGKIVLGKFKNVYVDPDWYEEFCKRYAYADLVVERLSLFKEGKGISNERDEPYLESFAEQDGEKYKPKSTPSYGDADEFFELAIARSYASMKS